MKISISFVVIIMSIIMLITSCTSRAILPSTPEAKEQPVLEVKNPSEPDSIEDWKRDWEKTLEAARKERLVTMYMTGGQEVRSALSESFFNKFGIRVDIVTTSGSEAIQKIKKERSANLYLWDIGLSGTTTFVTILKPEGMLTPLRPVLILPEVLEPKSWYGGTLPFVDRERNYIFASLASPSTSIIINASIVKPEELKSYKDMINPKWKDKISMLDPTIPGSGLKWFGVMIKGVMNVDYMKKFAEQKPLISRDKRLLAEWLARGKYPINISVGQDAVKPYMSAGVPLKLVIAEEGTYISTSGGGLVLLNKAPHLNAAKVFLNWFLSKEGATIYQNAYGAQSARVDVPTNELDESEVRKPNAKYFNPETEDFLLEQPYQMELAKEIFGPLIGR